MIPLPSVLPEKLRIDFVPGAKPFLLLVSLFLFNCPLSFAQVVNFRDGFSDGNFTENPAWQGDNTHFIIADVGGNFQLQLQGNKDSGGNSYLSAPSSGSVGEWEFYVNFDGFPPSDGNRAEIILMSDIADFNSSFNGYVLRGGENGSEDVFRIIRYDHGSPSSVVLSGTTDISSGGDYKVKVRRSHDGTWSLLVADTYTGVLSPEGGFQTDNTYTSTSYFGLKVTYSATRYDRFFFDFNIDLPPFTISNAIATNSMVTVIFNRAYDPASLDVSDFYISPNLGIPTSINERSSTAIELVYDVQILGNRYTLSADNVSDLHGESISPETELDFTVFDKATGNDIVINEFMYDPPIGLPEYVELKNRSGKYLNLMGWAIGDRSGLGTITQDTLAMEPGSLLVISPDTAALINFFGSGNYVNVGLGNFPSLNNGGDAIRILDENRNFIDSLNYTPDWGGEDIALERRSDSAPSTYKANWGDSPHGVGTPGSANLIETDSDPPVLVAVEAIRSNTLRLVFNEDLDPVTATNISNYTIDPSVEIQLISTEEDTVLLFLSEDLQSLQTYTVSVNGLRDIFGNTMSLQSLEITYIRFGEVTSGELVINEILYDEVEAGTPEFIELYNTSSKNVNLSGWLVGDANGSVPLPQSVVLLPGHYLVLTGSSGFADKQVNGLYVPGIPSLNDSGDIVYLKNTQGSTIDSLSYTSEWKSTGEGNSLERVDPSGASNDPSNWKAGISEAGNTAGLPNSVYMPDRVSPSMIFAKRLSSELISVRFNEFIKRTKKVAFQLDGFELSIADFLTSDANRIVLNTSGLDSQMNPGILQVRNLEDIVGNVTDSHSIPIARELKPGDIVINEIMYNPISSTEDNLPDQSEYVELKNIRDYAISLEGIELHDEADENGEVRRLAPVSSHHKWIPAGGIALIYADEEALFSDSNLAGFFELPIDNTLHLRIDRSSLSLDNKKDAIYLNDNSGNTIDSVYYSESWHNPNLLDTKGIALERISPLGPSNDASNWGSSTLLRGGSPGSENSIYQISSNQPETVGISFSPNPFSPDDDGIDDHLFINYKLDQPDYLLKVQIYDRYGRPVRKLADGIRGGFDGSLIWDGRNDAGRSNRIGIYIVVFEAINSATGRNRAFKKTVVLARRLQ